MTYTPQAAWLFEARQSRNHTHTLTDSRYSMYTHTVPTAMEKSNLKYVMVLPITTAMAPSANPKTRIRGAMKSFPAGKQKDKEKVLTAELPSGYRNPHSSTGTSKGTCRTDTQNAVPRSHGHMPKTHRALIVYNQNKIIIFYTDTFHSLCFFL